MRQLTTLSRRRFGGGAGAGLTLAVLPRALAASGGAHPFEVRISGFAFMPERIEITVGDAVFWVNDDLAPHTATARDGSWETPPLGSGLRARLFFETRGEFKYICAYHPHMTGTVSVRSRPGG